MTWTDRIFALIAVVVFVVGGGTIRRYRGRQGYARYSLLWISVWAVLLVLLIAGWLAMSRQAIH